MRYYRWTIGALLNYLFKYKIQLIQQGKRKSKEYKVAEKLCCSLYGKVLSRRISFLSESMFPAIDIMMELYPDSAIIRFLTEDIGNDIESPMEESFVSPVAATSTSVTVSENDIFE